MGTSQSSPQSGITPTVVFDTYWHFARERLAMYYRRLKGSTAPWTTDPILSTYRFTNTYRATDRVTQYLISEIQYHPDRSQEPQEIFFRTLIFKFFNKVETWEALERQHGPLNWSTVDLGSVDATLSTLLQRRVRIYSSAYITPPPRFGALRKHTNHLKLIAKMMDERVFECIQNASGLQGVYSTLLRYPGLGRFLAYQFAIDLNYSNILQFNEEDFVIAGPGAVDGVSKCFVGMNRLSPEDVIYWVTDNQERELTRRDINFPGLFGRKLQPIDCQNLFCEVSKYARVKHPEISGHSKRRRIKQLYKCIDRLIPPPFFPPRWNLDVSIRKTREHKENRQSQLPLL